MTSPTNHRFASPSITRVSVLFAFFTVAVAGLFSPTPTLAAEEGDSGAISIAAVEHAGPVDFEKQILPTLRRNCLACHNQTDAEAGLVLETPEAIREGGDSGEAVIPGNGNESLLLLVSAHREDPVMPPEDNDVEAKNLTPTELGLMKLWIDQGATGEVSSSGPVTLAPPPTTLRPALSVAVLSHGDYVAAGRANQISVYHVPSQQLVANLSDPALTSADNSAADDKPAAHVDMVHALAASSDGRTLASGGFRTVKLWQREPPRQLSDAEASRVVAAKEGDTNNSAADSTNVNSHDGKFSVSIDKDGLAQLFDANNNKQLATLKTNLAQERAAEDARRKAAVAKRVHGWAVYDRNEVNKTVKRAEQKVKQLGDDLQKLVKAGTSSTDAKYQKVIDALAFRATDLKQLSASVAEAEAIIAQRQKEVDTANAAVDAAEKVAKAPAASLSRFAFSPDSKQLAAADAEGQIHTFAIPSGAPLDVLTTSTTSTDALTSLAYTSDGHLVARLASGKTLAWQQATWSLARTIGDLDSPDTLIDRVTALAFSPDGKLLATGSGETARSGELKIWDVATGDLVRTFDNAHGDAVLGIEFSNDGTMIASCGADRNMRIFNVDSGERVQSFEYHTSYVLGVSWRADGRLLVTAGADNVVRAWNFKTGNEHKIIKRFDDKEVTGIQFLGNSGDFVVSAANNSVSRWNYNGGGGKRYDGVQSFMYTVATDLAGNTIAAGGHDGTVHVWSRDGKPLATFK